LPVALPGPEQGPERGPGSPSTAVSIRALLQHQLIIQTQSGWRRKGKGKQGLPWCGQAPQACAARFWCCPITFRHWERPAQCESQLGSEQERSQGPAGMREELRCGNTPEGADWQRRDQTVWETGWKTALPSPVNALG